jgi:polyvinyl alcohol dehydrogenase (cytochrome)
MLPSRTVLALLAAATCFAAPDGAALYKSRCGTCHDAAAQPRVPKREDIATRTPEFVLNAMSSIMTIEAAGLSEEEQRAIARYVTGKEFGAVTSAPMAGQCTSPAPKFSVAADDWNGWGVDPGNSRYQPKPGLSAADVPKLKLKWAFGYPKDPMAWAQPTVAGGRIFVGSVAGHVYSLDAKSGCIYWTYSAGQGAGVRSAVTLAKLANGKWVAYFGDIKGNAHALDAETGTLLWKMKLDDHPVARITGAPVFLNGHLFVPMSSIEEASAQQKGYVCCTFRGSLSSLDAATGKVLWKSYSVTDPPKTYKQNKDGVDMKGPAGAAIWSSPTIDLKRKLVYVATGNSYTEVETNTSDSILAFDMESGRLMWSAQVQPKDNFIIGCPRGVNCPEEVGPDFDFGSSPVLKKLPNGKDIIVAGQKSGVVWGLDPDNRGKVLWQTRLGKGSALGGVEWGHGADDRYAYVAISDRIVREGGSPGLYALDLATGAKKWEALPPQGVPGNPAQSAAISIIPGAVFSGALNGHFRAYSTADGQILWDFDTNKKFDTVNGVEAKGGSLDAGGPTIAHGMVYTNSGYGIFGGVPGNVLLAFSVDGK